MSADKEYLHRSWKCTSYRLHVRANGVCSLAWRGFESWKLLLVCDNSTLPLTTKLYKWLSREHLCVLPLCVCLHCTRVAKLVPMVVGVYLSIPTFMLWDQEISPYVTCGRALEQLEAKYHNNKASVNKKHLFYITVRRSLYNLKSLLPVTRFCNCDLMECNKTV